MSDEENEFKTDGLDRLAKALKDDLSRVRVGVLGSRTVRNESSPSSPKGAPRKPSPAAGEPTNASIGAKHEFGEAGMPRRSFLRVPIEELLQAKLDSSGMFGKAEMQEVLAQGSFEPWLDKVGAIAVGIVTEGFETGGYGEWAPWKDGYHSKGGQILVDTAQLKNSITFEVT